MGKKKSNILLVAFFLLMLCCNKLDNKDVNTIKFRTLNYSDTGINFNNKLEYKTKVNIIEYNPVEGLEFEKSSLENTKKFIDFLYSKGVNVSLRRSRGKDINAACGQLANKK